MTPRIAHVISTPEGVGGAERLMAGLVRAGEARGWQQVVLNPFGRPEPAMQAALPVPVLARSATGWTNLPGLRRWLLREIRSFEPDLVHAHLFHACVAVATLPRAGAVRVMSHHHGALLRTNGRKWDEAMDRWAGKRYDSVVAVSGSVQRFLTKEYGYRAERVLTIRNGWEGDPRTRPEGPQSPKIICVANLRAEKGHSTLLQAFARILARTSAELVLIGDGPLRAHLERQAAELGVARRTRFTGAVDDVWPHLAEADVFVLPSFYESLGIGVMEAMAAGLPVVASAVGGVPELVSPGVTGSLVPPGNALALAEELERLLSDPAERSALGAAGREKAQALRMEATVDSYIHLYTRLLDGRGRR